MPLPLHLELSDSLIIGRGTHKITYHHPTCSHLCVKILFQQNDIDMQRELKYRATRKQSSQLLPKYWGTINTNLGTGYIFEKILDFDNSLSLTLDEYIKNGFATMNETKLKNHIKEILLSFQKSWFKEKIVVSNIELVNFMVQRKSPTETYIKIVDNIGTPVLVPIAYYFDYFVTKRAEKYWKRFLNLLQETFPSIVTETMLNELYNIK